MSDTYRFDSYRSPVFSQKGIVGTSQPLATAAGIKILQQGGNAADAAVAAAAVLNVTEPGSTGIGGDAFSLFYEAGTGQISALNGSGRAPAQLSIERLKKEGIHELPPYHPYAITVPGACAAWFDLIERHGSLSMSVILAPAIELAETGFPVAPLTSFSWRNAASKGQLKTALNGHEMTINGRGPEAGEIFRNPGLAKTFRKIAAEGKQAYYQGEIASAIVEVIQKAGGCMTMEDLAAHQSTWEDPISVNYHGVRVWECPPNGQGLAALIALNILRGYDLAHMPFPSADCYHLMIEAMRLAFADARHYIADPVFKEIPLEGLLSDAYAEERRKLISMDKANPDPSFGLPPASSDTVYLSVVDENGNACSFINSNYMGFGTGIVPSGWGFTLQNRGHNFRLDPNHPNGLEPNKRPYHTIIPAMATREEDDSLYASFGVMGGFMQPQGHMQVALSLISDELDAQQALNRPRFCLQPQIAGGKVSLEEGISFEILSELSKRGHPVLPVSGLDRAVFGRGQVIMRDPETGTLSGGSDPRADGCVMTYI